MAELTFGCTGAHVVRYAATPTFALSLNITESTGVRLHAIALRCQIRIEPHRRRYTADEARRLNDLFGDTRSWAETAKPLQLATLTALVPGFTSRTEVELPVPCSYDLEVASARYLQVIEDGIIPLLLLFSGTVFVDHGHTYSVELIPWSLEVPFPMPARVWHDVIEEHFPASAWLRCGRQTLDALAEFKSAYALPTWDATLSALLAAASMPRDPSAYAYAMAGAPEWRDAAPEPQAAPTEIAAPELQAAPTEVTEPEPEAAATEVTEPEPDAAATQDTEPEPQALAPEPAVVPEPEAAAPEPEVGAPEPEVGAPEPEVGAPELTDAAAEDTAAEHATPAPEDAPPASADTPPEPQDTAPAEPGPSETAPAEPAPSETAPAEAAPEKRHTSTARRRIGTAARRTAGPRTGGGRGGGTP
ncbi:DUF6084 family protein [Trebonia kvetii]|uniref:DUF6084 family protein n=1 Tax=Trebonia kvetii TaxID=2480626 RepID=UPI002482F1AD|nr:DUF6084 family protein [Trebonia kvetii]